MSESRSRSGPGSRPPQRQPANSHALPKATLPKKLQLFFAPHSPIPYSPPMKKKKPALPYMGVAQYVAYFEDSIKVEEEGEKEKVPRKFRNPEYAAQCRIALETKAEKRQHLRKMKVDRNAAKIKQATQEWDPTKDEKIQGDPFKTLFLARMSYQVTERELKKVFGDYGPIRNLRVVRDSATGKSRGYAFVEYEHVPDMKEAYKKTDGVKIEGRRVVVDVERGRTMEGWRPARLGGGLGATTRKPKKPTARPDKTVARETPRNDRGHGARDDRDSRRSRDYGSVRSMDSGRRPDTRYRGDYRDRPPPRDSDHRERERDYGMSGRYRDRRYDGGGSRYEREHPSASRYDKRYRDGPPVDYEDRGKVPFVRPGKKQRDLEEGELDHREVKETRRRERDMV